MGFQVAARDPLRALGQAQNGRGHARPEEYGRQDGDHRHTKRDQAGALQLLLHGSHERRIRADHRHTPWLAVHLRARNLLLTTATMRVEVEVSREHGHARELSQAVRKLGRIQRHVATDGARIQAMRQIAPLRVDQDQERPGPQERRVARDRALQHLRIELQPQHPDHVEVGVAHHAAEIHYQSLRAGRDRLDLGRMRQAVAHRRPEVLGARFVFADVGLAGVGHVAPRAIEQPVGCHEDRIAQRAALQHRLQLQAVRALAARVVGQGQKASQRRILGVAAHVVQTLADEVVERVGGQLRGRR